MKIDRINFPRRMVTRFLKMLRVLKVILRELRESISYYGLRWKTFHHFFFSVESRKRENVLNDLKRKIKFGSIFIFSVLSSTFYSTHFFRVSGKQTRIFSIHYIPSVRYFFLLKIVLQIFSRHIYISQCCVLYLERLLDREISRRSDREKEEKGCFP